MTSPQDTLRREVEIGKLAARLRVFELSPHVLRGDGGTSGVTFERGARAGLTHLYPAVSALRDVLELLRDSHDTNHDPEGAVAVICEAALESVR